MIQVKSPHTFLLSGVVAICVNEGFQTIETRSDNDGMIDLEGQKCEKVYLKHVYFPNVPSLIKDAGNTNTYFEVTPLESWQPLVLLGSILPNLEKIYYVYPMSFSHLKTSPSKVE
ncbi:MAG: hypothetical protein IPL23_07055 [Saprospiraceae bacterium]|nr:hypothetical protein [Saprospiraceae bacterium]